MLSGDFFHITELEKNETGVHAGLHINADHKIFEGHFPGQPVVPGVCMMQMIKEIFENATGRATDLVKANEMKFMVIIDPTKTNIVKASLNYILNENEPVNLSAVISSGETIHFKFKGQFAFR